jgi:hypothetical protein
MAKCLVIYQNPLPFARQLTAMGDGEDDHQNTVHNEISDQHIGKDDQTTRRGGQTLKRVPKHYGAGRQGHQRRKQRPSKSRSLPSSECGDEAHDPRDEEQPSQEDSGDDACNERKDDRGKARAGLKRSPRPDIGPNGRASIWSERLTRWNGDALRKYRALFGDRFPLS